MVSLINDGNILFTGVITENGGHAINVYKITQDANDEDIYYLKVYDSNFPLNSDIGKNGETYIGEMEMMLKKHYVTTFNMGDIEYYTFSYNINKNWTFASNFFKNDDYLLIYYPVMKSNNLSLKKISTSLINY